MSGCFELQEPDDIFLEGLVLDKLLLHSGAYALTCGSFFAERVYGVRDMMCSFGFEFASPLAGPRVHGSPLLKLTA